MLVAAEQVALSGSFSQRAAWYSSGPCRVATYFVAGLTRAYRAPSVGVTVACSACQAPGSGISTSSQPTRVGTGTGPLRPRLAPKSSRSSTAQGSRDAAGSRYGRWATSKRAASAGGACVKSASSNGRWCRIMWRVHASAAGTFWCRRSSAPTGTGAVRCQASIAGASGWRGRGSGRSHQPACTTSTVAMRSDGGADIDIRAANGAGAPSRCCMANHAHRCRVPPCG